MSNETRFRILNDPKEVVDAILDYHEHKGLEPSERERFSNYRNKIMRNILLFTLLAASLPLAAEPQVLEPLNAPALPQTGPAGEEMEPEVRIIKKDSATIEEYRMNGELYMVKITPGIGLPYYLIDADGDGKLESRYNKLDPGIMVPQWMIHRW